MLLPGMLLTGAVPAVACEIYGALSALPYTRRYRLYSELRVSLRLHLLWQVLAGVLVRIRQTQPSGPVWLGYAVVVCLHLGIPGPKCIVGTQLHVGQTWEVAVKLTSFEQSWLIAVHVRLTPPHWQDPRSICDMFTTEAWLAAGDYQGDPHPDGVCKAGGCRAEKGAAAGARA